MSNSWIFYTKNLYDIKINILQFDYAFWWEQRYLMSIAYNWYNKIFINKCSLQFNDHFEVDPLKYRHNRLNPHRIFILLLLRSMQLLHSCCTWNIRFLFISILSLDHKDSPTQSNAIIFPDILVLLLFTFRISIILINTLYLTSNLRILVVIPTIFFTIHLIPNNLNWCKNSFLDYKELCVCDIHFKMCKMEVLSICANTLTFIHSKYPPLQNLSAIVYVYMRPYATWTSPTVSIQDLTLSIGFYFGFWIIQ